MSNTLSEAAKSVNLSPEQLQEELAELQAYRKAYGHETDVDDNFEEAQKSSVKTFAFLSGDGDNIYGWDEADNSWVIPMIQKKIDEGYTFWIVKRNVVGASRSVKLKKAEDARDTRKVTIKDPDARQLFEQGRIGIVARPVEGRDDEYRLHRRAQSAEEVAANDTVAHRAHRGG